MRDQGSHLLYCLSYVDRVLQRGGAWGSVYTELVSMQATSLAAAGSAGTPLTTWLDLEAGDEERDLCARAVAPFPLEGGCHRERYDEVISLYLSPWPCGLCETWEGKGT